MTVELPVGRVVSHIFNLTLAIAGDEVAGRLIFKPLGFAGNDPIKSLGREVKARYGWKGNVTQQDGFLVTPDSIVGIELKLGSKISSEQVLKYVTLMHREEFITGKRPNAGLLFIVPDASRDSIREQCGISGSGEIDESYLDGEITQILKKRMRKRIEEHGEAYRGLPNRLKLVSLAHADSKRGRTMFRAIILALCILSTGCTAMTQFAVGVLTETAEALETANNAA